MSTYTGSLQTKKKSELQEISSALDISDAGTREEIQNRIKLHLARHEADLSEDPRFSGLYGRNRKRSVQPPTAPKIKDDLSASSEDREERTRTANRRPHLPSPLHDHDSAVKVLEELVEPAHVPLPASPMPSAVIQAAASAIGRDANVLVEKINQQGRSITLESLRLLKNTRDLLSNSTNIYSITVLLELTFVLWNTVPSKEYDIPFRFVFQQIRYPEPSYLGSIELWQLLAKWSLPTLVIPQLFGHLISFNKSRGDFDPVTVGIMRVACSVAHNWGIQDDVLGSHWRILSASVGAAFAFAEAIGSRKRSQTLPSPAIVEEAT